MKEGTQEKKQVSVTWWLRRNSTTFWSTNLRESIL